MDIAAWLRGLGLEQYATAFRENAIDDAVLLDLNEADLQQLGVLPLGHRKRLLKAITALRDTSPSASEPVGNSIEAPNPKVAIPPSSAERRQLTVMFCDLVGSTALASR